MDEASNWYLRARYKYVWDKETLADYVEVLQEAVHMRIEDLNPPQVNIGRLVSPDIGFFAVVDDQTPEEELMGYALYISDARLPYDRRHTLFADFKRAYQICVFSWPLLGWRISEDAIGEALPHDQAESVISRKRKRARLTRNFMSLANKSLNHRRAISARVRYKVLLRDKSTCQVCGRQAPQVRLHVDHIEPVSWELDWRPSDDPDDYQVLCEDCNLGKGDMSWMLMQQSVGTHKQFVSRRDE